MANDYYNLQLGEAGLMDLVCALRAQLKTSDSLI